mmetsp:Transcript_2271/g.7656  ORF Transcript_2271/g.7656 Transcript_2271/m.7656 type:complete len:169 (+) Transcript_2271:357-863(+)
MRAFNGDWAWDPLQVASHLLHLAKAVVSRRVYASVGECLWAAQGAASSLPGGGFGAAFDVLCLEDVVGLVTRRAGSAVRALLEAAAIVSRARETALSDGNSSKAIAGLLRSARKLEFLASFAGHHEDAVLSRAAEVQSMAKARAGGLESTEQAKDFREYEGMAIPVLQ